MAIELISKIAPKNDGFTGMVDADQVLGGGAAGTLPNACVAAANVTQHEAQIDHDQLTNFSSTEHFTMLDEDNFASDSNTQAATQQSIKAYCTGLSYSLDDVCETGASTDVAMTVTASGSFFTGLGSYSNLDMVNNAICNIATPVRDYDASTKKYVDDLVTANIPTRCISMTVEDPVASEFIVMDHFPMAVTITNLHAAVSGSASPSVTIDPRHHANMTNAGNALLSSPAAITNTTTGDSVSLSGGDATIPANSYFWLKTTAQSGTVGLLHLRFTFTED